MPGQSADWRRALEVLNNSPEDATEAVVMAHGISSEVLAGLVRSGLATATTERMSGERTVDVTRVRITDAGRVALERR
jgi:hypothetical protein